MGKLINFLEQFDGYVIVSHFDDMFLPKKQYNAKYNVRESKDVLIWDVEFTLTSGETRNFFVKARNKQEALEKAESYSYLAGNNKKWERLLP